MGTGYRTDRTSLYENGGVARIKLVIGNPPRPHATCPCDSSPTKPGPGRQNAFRSRPRTIHKINWGDHETEPRIAPVVIASAEVGALRHADIATQSHSGEIVDPTVLANPAVISHLKVPWALDGDTRLDEDSFADPRTKETQ